MIQDNTRNETELPLVGNGVIKVDDFSPRSWRHRQVTQLFHGTAARKPAPLA